MSTKYELATELRQLTRGMKALPICKMTKAQLETEIDRIKLLKQIKEDVPDYDPAKRGHLPPRPIEATHVTSGDAKISVPIMPKPRMTEKPKPVRLAEKVTVKFDDTDPIIDLLTPDARADVISHTKVTARERPNPVKSLPSGPAGSTSSSKFSHPGAPKASDVSHRCNCPRCPGSLA